MTEKEASSFRKNLKELMKKNEVTGVQLAEILGVNKSTISDWLNGRYLPSGLKIPKIAKFFHVSVSYLVGKETSPYQIPNAITNVKEALDFLNYLNVLKGINVSQKTNEEWVSLAVTIHSILKMQGLV